MMTTFQTSGASAGTLKWSYALRIPTTRPFRPSSRTIGNSTCDRPVARSSSPAVSVSSGMRTGAASTKSAVIEPSPPTITTASVEARANASRRLPFSSRSVKTGTNAALSAESAKRLRTRLGTWKATVNAEKAPLVPK
jgi:hypothetical protein